MKNKCDGKFDCALKEDEADCCKYAMKHLCSHVRASAKHGVKRSFRFLVVLTDGEHVNVDSDNRPALNAEGLLARYANGAWRTECLQSVTRDNDTLTTRIGEKMCIYLGFRYRTKGIRVISDARNGILSITIEVSAKTRLTNVYSLKII